MTAASLLQLALVLALVATPCLGSSCKLKLSSFRDFTALLLESVQKQHPSLVDSVKYVKNADEAHRDLETATADMVFMSYDDTLTVALAENFSDIRAAWPIHGGMLGLCGNLDFEHNLTSVGIDTNTGYARVLRLYMRTVYTPEEVEQLTWSFIGATNLRFARLQEGVVNATLLNPPFTLMLPQSLPCVDIAPVTGPYQSMVGNVRQTFLNDHHSRDCVKKLQAWMFKIIQKMKKDPAHGIAKIQKFYNVTATVAASIYKRLWAADGLSTSPKFNLKQLEGTETVFAGDTGITIPSARFWVLNKL